LDLSVLEDHVERGVAGTRRKGTEQGVKLILLGIILVPVWMFIGAAFPPSDRFVESAPSTTWLEQIFWILMWMSFLSGAARIGHAYVFEQRPGSGDKSENANINSFHAKRSLPDGENFRVADGDGSYFRGYPDSLRCD
jgi:hypothetical protein